MDYFRRALALVFALCALVALSHCGRRGSPGGGPKDETPPVLVRAEPPNNTTGFATNKIRLYFDEYIRLQDVQNQLIVSPPLRNQPEISPMGGASKYVEIILKDTLLENTTYTLNFGQSVVDNNEGNPYNFLTYVFSTGDYIDSLFLEGAVADAFGRRADPFVSVMLYQADSAYTDSLVYRQPPYYITNTLDSAVTFRLQNLKAGAYRLLALKDAGKNNTFDQKTDKIGFVEQTVVLPTDSVYLLRLFREIPDYGVLPPSFAAANKIVFGYNGEIPPEISLLTPLPDSVKTLLAPQPGKDSLNLWITPFSVDSLVFTLRGPHPESRIDTFSVKPLKLARDSLRLSWEPQRSLNFADTVFLMATLPLRSVDTAKISMMDQDSAAIRPGIRLDTAMNRVVLDFEKEPNKTYSFQAFPGAFTDFFGDTHDTLVARWITGSPADYGTLRLVLQGKPSFPMIVELIDQKETLARRHYLESFGEVEFTFLPPGNYRIRIIFDSNGNGKWDTGSFLEKIQPEKVIYYPGAIDMRANWEKVETFTIQE
ncbi:Ig-like domain-containing protein [Robiginitalea marina]|uniref:Ig-like domain-containing protein n=1 Tax=Robiginitalea marina TaxID=2954105 RepID=A0ABT1AWU6_9FLAO|nr:Ig-like domain-containing protein [Robiginitalea marina]MCO5724476.1 Ig-like domain-containing protein [Robiginitalea marina]